MAVPSTIDDFLALVRKSGVVDPQRLDDYLRKLRSVPQHLGKFAGILVRDGILTHFQAEQFLQGKWYGFVIGKYQVLERLGWGGMGNVYLCEHTFMRRRVAVKVLATAHADEPAALQRFYREGRAVAALDHPNIVRAYDINQDGKLHFLVMEYVDGSSLQEIVKKHGPMDATRAAHYVSQLAVGLQHAHTTAGLVHRDIKPANILLERTGIVKILDMGLARFFHDKEDIITEKYKDNLLGTADYLAPEQALDSHSVDIRADIYSLGATFYFLLSGSTPFATGTAAQKLIWHQTRMPKSIKQLCPDVPDGLAAILNTMLAKDPADRYQTPSRLLNALTPWVQTPIGPPPEKEMPRLCRAAKGSDAMITLPAASSGPATPPPAAARPAPAPVPAPTVGPVGNGNGVKPAPAPARPTATIHPSGAEANPIVAKAIVPAPTHTPRPTSGLVAAPAAKSNGPTPPLPRTAIHKVAPPAAPPLPRTAVVKVAPPAAPPLPRTAVVKVEPPLPRTAVVVKVEPERPRANGDAPPAAQPGVKSTGPTPTLPRTAVVVKVEPERPRAKADAPAAQPAGDAAGNVTSSEAEELRRQIQLLTQQNNKLRQERDAALAQLRQLQISARMGSDAALAASTEF